MDDTKGWEINSFGLSDTDACMRKYNLPVQKNCERIAQINWQLSQRKSNNRVRAVKTPGQQESFRNNASAESALFRIECETRFGQRTCSECKPKSRSRVSSGWIAARRSTRAERERNRENDDQGARRELPIVLFVGVCVKMSQ